MSDRIRHSAPSRAPANWHDAFAALPLEAPPADGWQRFAPQLAKPPRRIRRVLPWAVAAATACLAALPVLVLMREPAPSTAPDARPATASVDVPPVHAAPLARAATTAAAGDTGPDVPGTAAPMVSAPIRSNAPVPAIAMDELHAESARLEALLAELSDDAGSEDGAQLALTMSLRSQVTHIDTALSGTRLDEPTRADLWQQRVDVLRELAGVAADQRWNALYGGPAADYALVQVY